MKCSLGISNFLEEISSLSHSVVFLYFFAFITEEGFLISSCYSLELCIQMLISFLFSFVFASLLFTAICKASPDSHFAFLHFFSVGMEKAMATHSSTLTWKIPWTEEPGGLQSMGLLRVGHDWVTSLSLFLSCIGEGNGNLLQCSCLENPRDRRAWWAAVYGVAQSRTWMKRLSSSSSSTQVFFVTWLFSLYFYYEAMYYCCLSMDEWSHCGCSDILIPASGIPEQLQWVCSSISFVCTMISLKL